MDTELLIFQILILVFSIILHEVSHGYAAQALGDPTARLAGRLTLNPLKHIDPLGSILIPGLLLLSGSSLLFGYAKPVPYNPYNLRGKFGDALVAGAGPAVNIVIALIFGLIIRFSEALSISDTFIALSAFVVYINILLALFNLIPIPPLDGSKVIEAILPFPLREKWRSLREQFERYGLIASFGFLFIFIYILWPYFAKVVQFFFTLITGVSF